MGIHFQKMAGLDTTAQCQDGWGAEFEFQEITAGSDAVCLRQHHGNMDSYTADEFQARKQQKEQEPVQSAGI